MNVYSCKNALTKNMSHKILLIENDEKLVEVLREILEQAGHELLVYPETYDIRPIVSEYNPDLVLLDFLLPGINGGELCSQLKRMDKYQHIPVIIMSAFPRVMLSLGDYGCNAFIPKPFELNNLLEQIEGCIHQPDRSFLA